MQLQRLSTEKEQISERLESAVLRYMIAEKKMDRLRSSQVAKVEAQAIGNSKSEAAKAGDPTRQSSQKVDGVSEATAEEIAAVESARNEAVAVSQVRAEQLEKLSQENKKLTDDLSAAQVRLRMPTDLEYANTDLFKSSKSQLEDMIKRINDLEALNVQLRTEAKQLSAERMSYKEQVDTEQRDAQIEMDRQAAHSDSDLTRIRKHRDDLHAEITQIKEVGTKRRDSFEQLQQLCEAREVRIGVLESEVERLRQEEITRPDTDEELAALDTESLRAKVQALQKEKSMLANEVHSMETAYRKANKSANQKISDGIDTGERLSRALQEKAKADQKYFQTMKLNDSRGNEVRLLKTQNSQTSQIVSSLKDAESSCRSLISHQEKQLAELNTNVSSLTLQQRGSQAKVAEQKALIDKYELHLTEMRKMLTEKDKTAVSAKEASRKAESDLAEVKTKLESTEKSVQSWKAKCESNQADEIEMMRVSTVPFATSPRKYAVCN